MPKVEVTGAKGLVQSTGSTMPLTLDTTNSVEKIAIVANSAMVVQGTDSIVSWTQPANTVLTKLMVLCTTAPVTAASVNIGVEIGTSSGGGEVLTAVADAIIDGAADGTDLVAGGLVVFDPDRKTTSTTTLAADTSYTASARTLYLNTPCSGNVTTAGACKWIIRYVSFA